jgi:hypothetical protein
MDMMSNHAMEFDEHASGYHLELDEHRAAIVATADLSGIMALEASHASRIEPHMTGMRHELGDMMGCMGPAGDQPDSIEVLGDLDRLQSECDEHREAMAAAADMTIAQAEESRHQAEMSGLMADMRTHAGAMMDGNGHFSCPHHAAQ